MNRDGKQLSETDFLRRIISENNDFQIIVLDSSGEAVTPVPSHLLLLLPVLREHMSEIGEDQNCRLVRRRGGSVYRINGNMDRSMGEDRYVFNCVFLQNPMCETMMRFGFDKETSAEYINEISDIIRPLSPLVVYLKNSEVSESVRKASAERGDEWLNAVIDYHCSGEYGKRNNLCGFDGYIAALEERQRRELDILRSLDIESVIINDPQKNWSESYAAILSKIK